MTGKKLYQLLLELSSAQKKQLIAFCKTTPDKRHALFEELLHVRATDAEQVNTVLSAAINVQWPDTNTAEKQVKLRRFQHYFCELIEQQLLRSVLQVNSSIRNVLLAKSLEKGGNLYLLNNYYDQAYRKSLEEEDMLFQLIGIKGKIRMKYMSHAEKELEEALRLNNSFIAILKSANEQKIAEYYEHASNIYLEKNGLISQSKEQYVSEIMGHLEQLSNPLNRVSLYVSLAKFHFDDDGLFTYFEQAKAVLNSIAERTNEFYVTERKARFLELRLKFFHGEDLPTLRKLTEEILQQHSGFSIINNHTLFYAILFELLLDHTEEADALLNRNHLYFKGDGRLLEHFLRALYFMKTGEQTKALHLLQPIMYGTHYFFAIFSRLMVIKLQTMRGHGAWNKSLIESTRRYLRLNSGNPLGQEANLYVLNQLNRQRLGKKNLAAETVPVLTALHACILEL